uniref:Uncharacterized protein n=1 Tax=Cajanus cajan TaxID=3821 RepID=A0A151UGA1_CAJCA
MREPHVDHANIAEAEDDPISKLLIILPRLKKKPIQLQWEIRVFGVDSYDDPLYISLPDALDIVGGNSMLNISIIQLWAMSHWQLMVIIPKEYTVVWFCSLHRKPSHEIKCQLQG